MPTSSARGAEFSATAVAEAQSGAIPRSQVTAKDGVTDAALKYHLYESPKRPSTKGDALALLPVRLSGTAAKQVEVELDSGLRLRFDEGCDPAYVAALVGWLR